MQKLQVRNSRVFFGILAGVSLLSGLAIFFFVHHGFIRNYGSDIVAVTFLYSLTASVLRPKPWITALSVLIIALGIETLQALVSLPHSILATLTVGSTFDPIDLGVYCLTTALLSSLYTLWEKEHRSLS
jgi:hypothetical protein